MNGPLGRAILWVAGLAVPAAVLLFSAQYLANQKSAALSAERALEECKSLAGEIRSARSTASPAASEPARQVAFTRQAADAAAAAGIPASAIERIEHEPARRSDSGQFLEKPSRVSLQSVTLRQAMTFVTGIARPEAAIRVSRLRLLAPRDAANSNTWNAEMTFVTLWPDAPPSNPRQIGQ